MAGSVLLALIPARHALSEIWPGRIDEVVRLDGSLSYQSASPLSRPTSVALSSTQPVSLVALEFHDGERLHGFLLPTPDGDLMLLETGVAESAVIDPVQIRRTYHPNAMTVAERLRLMLSRLADRRQTPAPESGPSAESMHSTADDSGESNNVSD